MQLRLLATGQKMPEWVRAGVASYQHRMPRELPISILEITPAKRHKSGNPEQYRSIEGESILQAIRPADHVVALEVEGLAWSTAELAVQLERWRNLGRNVALVIGGPDGLGAACRSRADQSWSLSPLTLPHPLVRVIVVEQLYRAWSILAGHPYHRE